MSSFVCDICNTTIPGSNCAYTLSRACDWKNISGCYAACRCGYPVRAKEVREHIFKGHPKDNNKEATTNTYIYCETDNGQGHVYYGTYNNCVKGNGHTASNMSSVALFERYSM